MTEKMCQKLNKCWERAGNTCLGYVVEDVESHARECGLISTYRIKM